MLERRKRNLGERASSQALRNGVLLAGVALGALFAASHFGLLQRVGWLVALPAAFAAYLLISGAMGICVLHGMRGSRLSDHGRESVLDPRQRSLMRNRALIAVSASLVIGFGLAAAFVVHG